MLRLWSRILLLALASLLVAGCGGGGDENGEGVDPAPALRVGLNVDKGQLDDNGFNELAFKGLERAQAELSVEGRVIESASAADYIPNMSSSRGRATTS